MRKISLLLGDKFPHLKKKNINPINNKDMNKGQFAVFVSYGLGLRNEERKGFNSYDEAITYAYQRANDIMLSGKRLTKDKDLHLWTDQDLNKIIRVYNHNFDLV